MNYYSILGLQRGCSQDEIKKAYRRLASQHHPDKGGDTSTFQNIQAAYDVLGNPEKRSNHDMELDNPFQRGGGPNAGFPGSGFGGFNDINDVFNGIFGNGRTQFNFNQRQSIRRNPDLNIRCRISLLDSYVGKEMEASYTLPSGRRENVVINIPPGIHDGATIQYRGMGDDSNTAWPRGNLNCTVSVDNDPNFGRRGDDLTTMIEIDPIEAMIGCTKEIESITGKTMKIQVRPGITHGGEYAAQGLGFPNLQTNHRGHFIIVILIAVPEITDSKIKKKLEDIRNEISKIS
jgi:DnaJ-class molecular chaperone